MIKVNVEKELDAKRKQSIDGNQIVDSAKLLLAGDHAKERDLLKKIGLGHQIYKTETQVGVNLERESIENKFEGKVFTEDEIKSLCLDYNLRFLSTKYFKGNIDLEIGVKIRHFFEKNKLNANTGGIDTDSFYIMAPKKAFNLEDRPKPPPVSQDPVLFYKPNRNDDKYLMVHKWGNEFTVARLIGGMMNRSVWIHLAFVWAISACITNIGYAMFGNYSPFTDLMFGVISGFVYTFIYTMCRADGGDNFDSFRNKFNDNCWNSNYKD